MQADDAFSKAAQLEKLSKPSRPVDVSGVGPLGSEASVRLRVAKAEAEREEQANRLRQRIANCALWFVAVQLAAVNLVMVFYVVWLLVTVGAVPSEVMVAWLSSTIVEIIGILWVIVRSLFPFHDSHRDVSAEK